IVKVLVGDQGAPRTQCAGNLRQQVPRARQKGKYPATPGTIGAGLRKRSTFQIELPRCQLFQSTLTSHGLQCFEEAGRPVERQDLSPGTNELSQIDRSVARATSNVEQPLPNREAGPLPRVKRPRPPDDVLQAQSNNLIVTGAQDVVAISHELCHCYLCLTRM